MAGGPLATHQQSSFLASYLHLHSIQGCMQAVVAVVVSQVRNLNSYPRPFWHICYNLLEHADYPSHRVFSLEQTLCSRNMQVIAAPGVFLGSCLQSQPPYWNIQIISVPTLEHADYSSHRTCRLFQPTYWNILAIQATILEHAGYPSHQIGTFRLSQSPFWNMCKCVF